MRNPYILPIFVALLSLSACGAQVKAPSLMPRAVEKQPIDMPVSDAVERETPADPALQAELAKQVAAAEEGDKAFAAQRATEEAAVSRATGKAQGSEEWVRAQEGITALEAARAPVRDAAMVIDALRSNPAYAGTGDRAAIDAAAARVEAIERTEAAAIATLTATLG